MLLTKRGGSGRKNAERYPNKLRPGGTQTSLLFSHDNRPFWLVSWTDYLPKTLCFAWSIGAHTTAVRQSTMWSRFTGGAGQEAIDVKTGPKTKRKYYLGPAHLVGVLPLPFALAPSRSPPSCAVTRIAHAPTKRARNSTDKPLRRRRDPHQYCRHSTAEDT
eukprot:5375421-Pleurochrysis_carterae.AAC.1